MTQSVLASNNLQQAAPASLKQQKSLLPLIAILLSLFVAEWFLFNRYFSRYIAHYLLGNWDQIGVYSRIYKLHFGLQQSGLNYLLTEGQNLLDKQAMKGTFVTFLGIVTTALFGPSRLAVICVNFFLFVSGQVAVAATSYRRFGFFAALLSVGLCLLSLTHYILVGGINDMRLDYAAMQMMGWAFLANFLFLERGGKSRFVLAATTLLLNVLTRSILIIYWNVGSGILLALSLLRLRVPLFKSLNVSPLRVFSIFVASVSVFALFLLVFWDPFSKYYIFRVANGEAALRASAYGCHGYLETFAFNCARFGQHFQYMFESVGVILAGLVIFQRQEIFAFLRRVASFAQSPFFLLYASMTAGCLLSISCFMPSPNHIGVLTIPCALFLTLGTNSLIDATAKSAAKQKLFLAIASCLVFVGGIGLFAREMLHPSFPPRNDAEMSDLVKRSNEIICREMEPRDVSHISYPILSEEWNFAHLEVYWYENKHKALPENYGPVIITPFQKYDWNQLKSLLDSATFVVLPVREPLCTEEEHAIKGQAVIRKFMPQIKEELDKAFYPVAVLDNNTGYSVGIFKNRKP